MLRRDAAVDDSDADAHSIEARLPGGISAYSGRRQVQKAPVRPVRRDIFDVRIGFQRGKKTGGHSHVNGIDRVEDLFHLAVRSELLQLILGGWSLELNYHIHRRIRIRRW